MSLPESISAGDAGELSHSEEIHRLLNNRLVGYVQHGATAATDRPEVNGTAAACALWDGSVEPTNATSGDFWWDTANDSLKRYDGSSWTASSNGASPAASATGKAGRVVRTAGNITANSTSWVTLGVTDITLQDVTAGEWIEVGLSIQPGSESPDLLLDCATVVSGAFANTVGGAAGPTVPTTFAGVQGWSKQYGALFIGRGGRVLYQLQADDIDASGNVTLRLIYRTGSAANVTVHANTGRSLIFDAKALG